MLRIPARYVTGYVVEEYSQRERKFLVRQRHAHAWAEALVDGHWIEVDTTPLSWIFAEEEAASFWQPILDIANFVSFRFSVWRRELGTAQHPGLLWSLGIAVLIAITWFGALRAKRISKLKGPRAAAVRGQQEPASRQVRVFRELEHEFAILGLGRHPTEPARAWLGRVAREGASILREHQVDSAREIIEALYRERYAH